MNKLPPKPRFVPIGLFTWRFWLMFALNVIGLYGNFMSAHWNAQGGLWFAVFVSCVAFVMCSYCTYRLFYDVVEAWAAWSDMRRLWDEWEQSIREAEQRK